MNYPQHVSITEVGPRDGLQNESQNIPTATKAELITRLHQAGLARIEATSFVRPDRIPQLQDAAQCFSQVSKLAAELPCLVPNAKGLARALQAGVKEIAVFIATSDAFNQKNANTTLKDGLSGLGPVITEAVNSGVRVRGYISTAFGCPYQGRTSTESLLEIAEFFFSQGIYQASLGDTIGCATPGQVNQVLATWKKHFDCAQLALHFHDTRGMALANVLVGLEHGVCHFDSSVAGLGGCPYAKGASGNLATEELVYLLHSLGIKTNINLLQLLEVGAWIMDIFKRPPSSKLLQTYLAAGKNQAIFFS